MAAPALRILKRAAKAIGAALALLVVAFPLAGWIGSALPRNDAPAPVTDGVEIMVETNGVHTGIVMPIVSPEMDWRTLFPSAALPVNGRLPTHVAVGWGEREVFLNVPTWGDLKPGTALRIAIMGGAPVMRVSHYIRPAPGPNHRPVMLSRADYGRMVEAIAASLADEPAPREILRGTNPRDAYYHARGHYTLVYTCNNWVADMLAQGGVQMGRWTPFAGGVMKWIEPPSER